MRCAVQPDASLWGKYLHRNLAGALIATPNGTKVAYFNFDYMDIWYYQK
jgi:hypothetical protein